MNELKVLDVTLRDGGCVNGFNFGNTYIEKILAAQEAAGIDIIELGYIDEKNGSESGRTQYIDETAIVRSVLHRKKPGITYVAMIDYGKFDVNKLKSRTDIGIDGVRMAFHKENYKDMILPAHKIMEKGYRLYIQPMLTQRYSDAELLEMIDLVNRELPNASAFYIVDSFGEMRPNDLTRILSLVDHNLAASMAIGFHSHNNLQMSYSNACTMLQFTTSRDMILDSSIMGMGKGAGNLNTELLVEHLNSFYGKNYLIAPLLSVIDNVINQIHNEFYWGYAVEYYLSSIHHCSPSYASYFYDRHMLPIDQVGELLSKIAENKKLSFDKKYAEELYRQYNTSKAVNDTRVIERLKTEFKDKKILLVAPGKNILEVKDRIRMLSQNEEYITVGLNVILDIDFDYILTTREDIYKRLVSEGKSVIAPSNISQEDSDNVLLINYGNWIEVDERTHDSSSVLALRLLKSCGVKEILLAGFDGFSVNINENYYNPDLRHPISAEQQERRNQYYKGLISRMKDCGISIQFMTSSKYEDKSYG